jgi:alkanesulfonate monooxygenase SsuD/methylene tetrahydromethanopterin reductase-like flavin-dependent oxidoreductase (luciferase family)
MKFGIALSIRDWMLSHQVAVEADKLEYDSIFISDHYMSPSNNNSVDVWTLLAYLSAIPKKIRLGTIVTPIPFRNPAITAKIVATVDLLSGGRVIFGVGVGWYKPEFDAYSFWDIDQVRVEKFKEGINLILKLWTKNHVNFNGKFF